MRGLRGPLMLALARGRRNPRRWAAPGLAIAMAVAFAGAVAAKSVIVGDQAARSVIAASSPLDRTVRVTWQGPLAPGTAAAVRRALGAPELGSVTQVLALDPVRLSGVIVQTAAIDEVATASSRLLRSLETNAAPRNREEEAAKAKARAAERYSA